MSQISLKSISGITSITTPAGVDNRFSLYNYDSSERFVLDHSGNLNISGVTTATNFKTGTTDLHSLGLTAASADIDDFLDVGSNIKLGNAGVITATSYRGDGSQLTGIVADKIFEGNTEVETIDTGSDGHVKITTEGSERLRITSGGDVTTTGTSTFSRQNAGFTARAGDSVSITRASGTPLEINRTGSDGQMISLLDDNTQEAAISISGGSLQFGTPNSSNPRLVISSAGYVGINQSSPQTGLHINQDWVNSYGSISVEGSANALVGLGLRSNGNYRASLIWRDGSSGNYLDIATYGAAYPILFRPNGTEKVRITGGGDLEMTGGTVSLKEHMIRVGNRTTAQINAGVSTSTGSLTLDTTTNNLKVYVNNQWSTVKKQGNDGSTQSLAARSAKALLDDGITSNGVYWLDMHGAYSSGNAKLHYCLMDTSYDGGGWTMLYSMNHGNNFASGSNYSFSLNVGSPTSVSDFTAGNWGYDRRNTFLPAANDQFLIRRSDNNDWKRFVVTTWSPTANSVSNGWETLNRTDGNNTGHPYWALGQMYDASGNSVSGHTHFNGCAKGGNCNSGGGDGSGFGNYSQWLDCVGNSGFGGGYNSQGNGGSPLFWGQNNALSQGGSLYIQMFYRKAGTQ